MPSEIIRVDVLGRKYVFGPSQNSFAAGAKMSRAKNIFTPVNINYIVILINKSGTCFVCPKHMGHVFS